MAKDTKEHILETSLILFLQKGFKGVTMKDIVQKTEMTKGAFYYYFESKQQVFEEVVHHFFAVDVAATFKGHNEWSLKEFYNRFIEDHFQQMNQLSKQNKEESLNQFSLMFDAMKYIPNFKNQFNEHNKVELQVWKTVIQNAKHSGEIETELAIEKLAKLFMFSGDGYALHSILMNTNIKETKKSYEEVKAIWDGLYDLIVVRK